MNNNNEGSYVGREIYIKKQKCERFTVMKNRFNSTESRNGRMNNKDMKYLYSWKRYFIL